MDDIHPHIDRYRFCPVCGGRLTPRQLKELEPPRLTCIACGFVFYLDPKLVSCVILESAEGIVLLKRAIPPQKGRWVMPGGYVDRGETLEHAAIRETREECGLKVELDGLLGLYSYPGQVPVIAVYTGTTQSGRLIAGDETEAVRLFPRDRIPWDDLAFRSTIDALSDYCRTPELHHTDGNRSGPLAGSSEKTPGRCGFSRTIAARTQITPV